MNNSDKSKLPASCKIIELPRMDEKRGTLTFLENDIHIPFSAKRVFWIKDVPEGETRGGHAHRTCHEAVFALQGKFSITVDDGTDSGSVVMDSQNKGLLIPAGVWCNLEAFSSDAVCLVVASQEYDKDGYINDYEQFKAYREK